MLLQRFSRSVLAGTALVSLSFVLSSKAQAQAVWGGSGSTTSTSDYGTGSNWSTGVAPTGAGQSAQFQNSGAISIATGAPAISPDSWTFLANSKGFDISGGTVNFAVGVTNNANAGQAISI